MRRTIPRRTCTRLTASPLSPAHWRPSRIVKDTGSRTRVLWLSPTLASSRPIETLLVFVESGKALPLVSFLSIYALGEELLTFYIVVNRKIYLAKDLTNH